MMEAVDMNVKEEDKSMMVTETTNEEAEVEGTDAIHFNPPIYLQRYGTIQNILQQLLSQPENKDLENGRTIMEVGCAEFALHIFLKGITELGKIIYVDIDEKLLMDRKNILKPFPAEYLQRPNRPKPLVVEAYVGDITSVDSRIMQENPKIWGVVAIELIEHLVPEDVRGFEISVFGVINPQFVLVTTPNACFNPVFNLAPGKFRHWDHKFEWSRQEFKQWCDKVCNEFSDYAYEIMGIGMGPPETEQFGCVSQMAIFKKVGSQHSSHFPSVIIKEDCYKLIESIVYPNHVEKRSLNEIIVTEVDYLINHCWLTKRNIEQCMENGAMNLVFTLKEVLDMLPTKYMMANVDVNYFKNTLVAAKKYEICSVNGEDSICISVPHWDAGERDSDFEDEMEDIAHDLHMNCRLAEPFTESNNDDDDCWE